MTEDKIKFNPEQVSEDIVRKRMSQNSSSRLAEYLVGLEPGDPRMVSRLIEDKKAIRDKYGLPPDGLLIENPRQYYNDLVARAKRDGVDVKDVKFLSRIGLDYIPPDAAAYIPELDTIAHRSFEGSEYDFVLSVRRFEHEYIHSIQTKRYPRLPIEAKEYEAYLAGTSDKDLDYTYAFFSGPLVASIKHKYAQRSDGEKPEWDNPFWFLKNIDKVDVEVSKFISLDEIDKSLFNWKPNDRELDQVRKILEGLVGKEGSKYFHELVYYRIAFDRAEIRTKYGLPKYRGSSMEKYVENVLDLAQKEGIDLEMKDKNPEDFRAWKRLAEDLDEQFIRAKQVSQQDKMERPHFQREYEAFIGAAVDLGDYRLSGVTSNLAWYADGKPPEDYY